MQKSSYIVLKSILNTAQSFERLTPYLENAQLQKLNAYDVSNQFSYKHFSTENIISHIHYSWFILTLKNFKDDLSFCIAALPEKSQLKLKNHFNLESNELEIDLSSNLKEYVLLVLLSSLLEENSTILPPSYLPYSPMNILTEQTKEMLIKVIDYLALFDLAADLRKTLNTNTIKIIYSFLNENEIKFLKKTSAIKDLAPLSSILEKCDGTKDSFRKALHKKGLFRLAFALSDSHPDLIWYLCHLLDVGRGSSLMKMCEKKVNPVISDTIKSHVLKILEFLQA